MTASLFIDRHATGLAFYINGDLQFDTADEAIYHHYLVAPAIALAMQRFPDTPLRVLICGGGDGLAARDVLRFTAVADVALVDYSAEVVELGRTVFRPYNQDSLALDPDQPLGASRVTVHISDAWDFVAHLPDACFHVVLCDFTYPTRSQDTNIYSRDWFQQVRRVLCPGGVMSTNAVSPDQRTLGFWCLYQTLLAADLAAKPLRVMIPSFQAHGYGEWGFFWASDRPIQPEEVAALVLPSELTQLSSDWVRAMRFPQALAADRHQVRIHTIDAPQLFYYLLNPGNSLDLETSTEEIDFQLLQETGSGLVGDGDPLNLEAIAQQWLAQLDQARPLDSSNAIDSSRSDLLNVELSNLLPVQHRYHSQPMTDEWLKYIKSLLQTIDGQKLVTSLLDRARELPPQLAQELQHLRSRWQAGQPLGQLSTSHTAEMITLVTVTLLMANLAAPDAVFAKGFSSSGYRSGGSSSDVSYYYDDDGFGAFGGFGFWMAVIGGLWLFNLSKRRND